MKIVIPGGSGQVGTVLARSLYAQGHQVVVLSRSPKAAPWPEIFWDAKALGDWSSEFEEADAVINLAGRSVNCRYTSENRRAITESRVDSVRVVGKAITRAAIPPRVWLQASTATIYAHRFDAANDEANGVIGGSEPNVPETWRFSIGVANAWERALDDCSTPQTRQIKMRSAIIMSPDAGGAFDTLLGLVRHGLGGHSGNGKQYVSWIHEQDFVRAVHWMIAQDDLSGPVNISSPNPVPNDAFMDALRQAWGARIGLPAANWMLEIGARLLHTETELILKSRRVAPTRLLEDGFTFTFPTWPEASRDLCRQWRRSRQGRTPSAPGGTELS